ncbi:MAG: hypothetical protein HY020_23610, partial [Burkholderiales bacterium]|nr:hypothetical protein [Burkholderiales bacterium]
MSIAHFCELLAAEIHTNFLNGDTQSTTTVCFNGANGTLYVATQGDKLNLQHLLQPKERQATHALLMKNQLATGSAGGYKKLKVGAVAPTGQDRLPDAWQLIDQVS